MTYSRLICILPSYSHPQDLTLDGVDVYVSIVDMHAQVCMSQRFTNPFESNVEATYSFALLANSAVCGFEMVRGDGTRILGEVMEKRAAKQAYQTAVSQGQTASLGEEQTKDVFMIKVGNIFASETVTINLTFLTPLIDDEKRNQVRFTFPRGYAFRYGTPPTEDAAKAFPTPGSSQLFNISTLVQQSGPIKAISCPSSHPIQLSLGRPEGAEVDTAIPESHFASVKLTSPSSFLAQDFVLVVTADGLDTPRCFVEPHPSPNENTTAFGMTFVPRFNSPDSPTGMEYIFVVDRSGSMEGTAIKLVREALVVLLRGLPTSKSTFNIFSFGSKTTSLWSSSKSYTQATLEEATRHVDSMDADYGGTEIAQALKKAIGSLSKKRQRPVSIFLLTDGGAWDVSTCEEHARGLVAAPGAFGRIFTVGIGSGVSTDTVDSIARAGEGMAIYVQDGEPMTGKLARLVRASRTPAIKDIEVLWPRGEEDFEVIEEAEKSKEKSGSTADQAPQPPIGLYNEGEDSNVGADVGPPPKPTVKPEEIPVPAIQRAPLQIPGLFPGTRTQMYAIVSSLSTIPSSVKVRGKVATTGDMVELEVPVARAATSAQSHHAFIHTLAARALITDREDGKHQFHARIAERAENLQAHIEADIIRIGTKYGLTSRHTSYVAIDKRSPQQQSAGGSNLSPPPYVAPASLTPQGGLKIMGRQRAMRSLARVPEPHSYAAAPHGYAAARSFFGVNADKEIQPGSAPGMPAMPGSSSVVAGYMPPLPMSYRKASAQNDLVMLTDKAPICRSSKSAGLPLPSISFSLPSFLKSRPKKVVKEKQAQGLMGVARLQKFDGSFVLSDRLLKAIGSNHTIKAIEAAFTASGGVSTDAMATALALVWMKKEAEEEAQDMIQKAEEWLKKNPGRASNIGTLETIAKDLL